MQNWFPMSIRLVGKLKEDVTMWLRATVIHQLRFELSAQSPRPSVGREGELTARCADLDRRRCCRDELAPATT